MRHIRFDVARDRKNRICHTRICIEFDLIVVNICPHANKQVMLSIFCNGYDTQNMFFHGFDRQKRCDAQFSIIQLISIAIICDVFAIYSVVIKFTVEVIATTQTTAISTAVPTAFAVTCQFRLILCYFLHCLDHNTLLTLSFNAQDPYCIDFTVTCADSQERNRWLPVIRQIFFVSRFRFFIIDIDGLDFHSIRVFV